MCTARLEQGSHPPHPQEEETHRRFLRQQETVNGALLREEGDVNGLDVDARVPRALQLSGPGLGR